jgi:hypothetical protein
MNKKAIALDKNNCVVLLRYWHCIVLLTGLFFVSPCSHCSGVYQYKFDVPFAEIDIPFNKTDTLNMVQFFSC